jgi:hypothetical protein
VSSHPGEKGVGSTKRHRNTPCAREKPRPDWKKDLQPVAREENHEKSLRWSWARNQMGNPEEILIKSDKKTEKSG